MYKTNYQGKLIALLTALVFCLLALVLVLYTNTPVITPPVTVAAPAGMAIEPACNALVVALGGCK